MPTAQQEANLQLILQDEGFSIVRNALSRILGFKEALVVVKIHGWIMSNCYANRQHYYRDDFWWMSCNQARFLKELPTFKSAKTLSRTMTKLREQKIVVSDRLSGSDRTAWYRIDIGELEKVLGTEGHRNITLFALSGKKSSPKDVPREEFGSIPYGQSDRIKGTKWRHDPYIKKRSIEEINSSLPEEQENPEAEVEENTLFSGEPEEIESGVEEVISGDNFSAPLPSPLFGQSRRDYISQKAKASQVPGAIGRAAYKFEKEPGTPFQEFVDWIGRKFSASKDPGLRLAGVGAVFGYIYKFAKETDPDLKTIYLNRTLAEYQEWLNATEKALETVLTVRASGGEVRLPPELQGGKSVASVASVAAKMQELMQPAIVPAPAPPAIEAQIIPAIAVTAKRKAIGLNAPRTRKMASDILAQWFKELTTSERREALTALAQIEYARPWAEGIAIEYDLQVLCDGSIVELPPVEF